MRENEKGWTESNNENRRVHRSEEALGILILNICTFLFIVNKNCLMTI